MAWQDVITGAARTDFERWMTTERLRALERCAIEATAADGRADVRALDRLRALVCGPVEEAEKLARHRERIGVARRP